MESRTAKNRAVQQFDGHFRHKLNSLPGLLIKDVASAPIAGENAPAFASRWTRADAKRSALAVEYWQGALLSVIGTLVAR
jgi:hypothetical protein